MDTRTVVGRNTNDEVDPQDNEGKGQYPVVRKSFPSVVYVTTDRLVPYMTKSRVITIGSEVERNVP